LEHAVLQEHMYGRYYLPPSLLYSIIRLSRDGATYDVPVDTDWVTIAVVAERGTVKVSGANNSGGGAQMDDSSDDEDRKPDVQKGDFSLASPAKKKYQKPKAAAKDSWKPRGPKKYITFRLAALPSRAKQLTQPGSGTGGDAILQLLLFQAESVARTEEVDDEGKPKVTYSGGSGGAFERWGNMNVGDVVGIISPRILRPLRVGFGPDLRALTL
jgi:minichromosome maintenance protein 10